MSDDIIKSTFQWEYMKATMFGGPWAKDMLFPSFICNDIKLQAFDFIKAIDIYCKSGISTTFALQTQYIRVIPQNIKSHVVLLSSIPFSFIFLSVCIAADTERLNICVATQTFI